MAQEVVSLFWRAYENN